MCADRGGGGIFQWAKSFRKHITWNVDPKADVYEQENMDIVADLNVSKVRDFWGEGHPRMLTVTSGKHYGMTSLGFGYNKSARQRAAHLALAVAIHAEEYSSQHCEKEIQRLNSESNAESEDFQWKRFLQLVECYRSVLNVDREVHLDARQDMSCLLYTSDAADE